VRPPDWGRRVLSRLTDTDAIIQPDTTHYHHFRATYGDVVRLSKGLSDLLVSLVSPGLVGYLFAGS
jgi:hypothetical protein